MNPTKGLSFLNQAFYLIFFIGLIFSFRAVSSISIGLMLVTGIIKNKLESGTFFHNNVKNRFLVGCILFYLLYWVSLLYTYNMHEGWNGIQLKSGLLFTPLAVCCTNYINADSRKKLLRFYCIILAVASLYCHGSAFLHYRQTGDPSMFYYHQLVSPLKQHAVYFSIFVFIALVFLFESIRKNNFIFNKAFHICLAIYFSVFLVLLLSKLVIVFYLLYLLYYFIMLIKVSMSKQGLVIGSFILFITISSLVLTIPNPVRDRFNEVIRGDIRVVQQEKFSPADYFNGLQFRLLQWKFVAKQSLYIPYGAEIFTESNPSVLSKYKLLPHQYFLLIARMEPENNIEMIIQGWLASNHPFPLFIIGNITNKYGKKITACYNDPNIKFNIPIYDNTELDNLRYYSNIYFHGHSTGGTNPSLLEAMACECSIAAHNNIFNRAVLQNEALYFSAVNEVSGIINASKDSPIMDQWKKTNIEKIRTIYNHGKIIDAYEKIMLDACE